MRGLRVTHTITYSATHFFLLSIYPLLYTFFPVSKPSVSLPFLLSLPVPLFFLHLQRFNGLCVLVALVFDGHRLDERDRGSVWLLLPRLREASLYGELAILGSLYGELTSFAIVYMAS